MAVLSNVIRRIAVLAAMAAMGSIVAGPSAAQTPPSAATGGDAAARLPTAAFAELPFVEQPRLSPNGLYLAGIFAIGGEQRLMIMPVVGDRSTRAIVAVPDGTQINSLTWVNDDHVLVGITALVPVESDNWYVSRYFSIDRASGKITRILRDQNGQGMDLLWVASDGSSDVLIAAQATVYTNEDGFWPAVYRVDVATGRHRRVEAGRANVWEWGADARGDVRYGIAYNDVNQQESLLYRSANGNALRNIERANLLDEGQLNVPTALNAASDTALVVKSEDGAPDTLIEANMVSGAAGRTIYTAADHDIDGVWVARDGQTPLGVFTNSAAKPMVWIDPAMIAHQDALNAASPKSVAQIISVSADRTKILALISTPDNPGLLFYQDATAGQMVRLAAMNDAIGGKRLSRVKAISYKARDGLGIEAMLTLPRGRTAKSLPFIVMPHGGPWSHDSATYDYWAQFLAERGYGVIQPNFRGSTGYGQDFVEKGHGQIGLAMQDDVSDAVRWAVGEGLADPARICIVGASYGGYAAMWGIAKDPDQYRCAISIAGVSNMRKEVSDFGDAARSRLYRRQWAKMSSDFAAVSPINAIDRIKVPLLLVHGKKDVTVDHGQSERMAAAMRRAGKAHDFVSLPLADHYFTRKDDRMALLAAMEAFLKAHNPAD